VKDVQLVKRECAYGDIVIYISWTESHTMMINIEWSSTENSEFIFNCLKTKFFEFHNHGFSIY